MTSDSAQDLQLISVLSFLHLHLPLNRGGLWGTTDDFTTSSLHFSLFSTALALGELQASPFLDVVFPSLFLSALSYSPFHCALPDGFGQTG